MIRHGSAFGAAVKLPHDVEINAEAGVGWNADRETGPGWTATFGLTRFLFR
jgi:hypothetical protein